MPVGSVEDPSPGRSLSRLVGFRPPRSPVRSPETSVPEVAPVRSLKRLLRSPSGLASVVSCTAGTWTLDSGAATGVDGDEAGDAGNGDPSGDVRTSLLDDPLPCFCCGVPMNRG